MPRLNLHNSSITATKITTFVGSSTSDLRLRHKTYHCVDFQVIYTKPLESSLLDHPRAATRRSKIQQLFHAPHTPSVLVRSTHRRCHRNLLSPIYITGEESALSNYPRALMHRPKLWRGLNHAPHAPLVTCWCHHWHHPYHVSIHVTATSSLPCQHPRHYHVIIHVSPSLCHLADVIIGVDRWLWLRLLTLTVHFFSELTFCNPGIPCPVFRVDFILQSVFAYFASKWRIRIGLLLFATIVANNPTNVFAIFANVLAIILRLAINGTSQLFPFLLQLLTLRVSNPWLLSLLDPLSPFPKMTL